MAPPSGFTSLGNFFDGFQFFGCDAGTYRRLTDLIALADDFISFTG